LPEFFSLKGVFKKIGRAVKKFASSTVGKIIIGAALFTLSAGLATPLLGGLGSAAVAAGQGFIAGAGGNLLAGGNLKDSLKAGAKGALAAGAFTAIKEGASAFKAIKPAGTEFTRPTQLAEQLAKPQSAIASPAVDAAEGITRSPLGAAVAPTPNAVSVPVTAQGIGSISTPSSIDLPVAKPSDFRFYEAGTGTGAGAGASAGAGVGLQSVTQTPPGFLDNIKAALTKDTMGVGGSDTKFFEGINKAFNPNQIKLAGTSQANDFAITEGLKAGAPGTAAYTTAYDAAYKAAMPGMMQQFLPLVAGGLGIMAATGGLDAEQPEIPAGYEDMVKGISAGQKLLTQNPELYGLRFGGVNTTYAYNPAQYAMPYAPYVPPVSKRQGGGVESLMGYKKGSPASYPRKTGHIAGPGTGTSDDVPAMLSDGEFVFTAKAVRAMGNGSRRAGAKRMYALMKNLEGRKNG
jgi:hypothetical protein